MRSVKCVVIGDGGVGKSSLLISYTTNTFPQDYVPTVFDNYSTTIALKGKTPEQEPRLFKLNLWDTAGQEEYDTLRPLSYPQTDIFLICFSVSEPSSFVNVKEKWLAEVKRIAGITNSDLYRAEGKYPILLVGTKADLRENEEQKDKLHAMNSDFISQSEINKLVDECKFAGYVECSAATQIGVTEVFETAVEYAVYEEKLNKPKKEVRKNSSKKYEQKKQAKPESITASSNINSDNIAQSSHRASSPNVNGSATAAPKILAKPVTSNQKKKSSPRKKVVKPKNCIIM
ncbi:hypothetical protein Kpol_1041p7 [Vanderwaltozyma polyspora DSM 70294]|uniref:Uncharacterized protein n=1 Tax=Vanderwaltozyma polyspora (strain ATCC 22028 / DSM 70294 / BCRC 21397 / CBS 2163 / NBRC 10782 / NRRL Y-8283 / UCD 57-17) TaxID=436907 RepID=A7TL74_VANPO|nr:uncharacterized protein Kpol_1041p7 [Vanderwaltozyma polyspora DSM 70294]EDO16949.1 hypothetical protein Kpol_1041p7 [Vanderwaltozyma polyspora DSM 70294]